MAERRTRPLDVSLRADQLALAVAAERRLDTRELVCLHGRWATGPGLIGWNPAQQTDDATTLRAAGAAQPSCWVGWQAYGGTGSWWGRFDTLLRQDDRGHWRLDSSDPEVDLEGLAAIIEAAAARPVQPADPVTLTVEQLTAMPDHLAAVEHAISAIRAGQLYQVNVCARIRARLHGSPLQLFAAGAERLAGEHAGYAAFLQTHARTVVSFSPELFLQRTGRSVTTRPIKGTRARADGIECIDDPAAVQLQHSVKDRAENVMITDLMRNDLSRVCRPGTVTTGRLLQVVPAPGVWHLVSEVHGELAPGIGDADLLAATFPPGSVTGAPKAAATELIAALEPVDRGVFTGAIGVLGLDGVTALSVAIRTFECRPGPSRPGGRQGAGDPGDDRTAVELGVGGGITADSVPVLEWRECLVKAAPLLALGGARLDPGSSPVPVEVSAALGVFDTMLAVDGVPVGLDDHLVRLESSVNETQQRRLPADLPARVAAAVAGSHGRQQLRITVRPDEAEPQITVVPAATPPDTVALVTRSGRTGSWRHKWNDRRFLAAAEDGERWALFVDEQRDGRYLQETSRSSVLLVPAYGVLITPPLSDQVLAGVGRRRLLDAALDRGWQVSVRPLRLVECADGLLLSVNSLGLRGVESVDGHAVGLDRGLLGEVRSWLG